MLEPGTISPVVWVPGSCGAGIEWSSRTVEGWGENLSIGSQALSKRNFSSNIYVQELESGVIRRRKSRQSHQDF